MTSPNRPRTRDPRAWMIAVFAAVSVIGHGALLGAPIASSILGPRPAEARPPIARSAHLGDLARRAVLPVILAADRRDLVERARADLRAGKLDLGGFVLETNAIDAREQGQPFDLARAKDLYAARLEAMRAATGRATVRAAVPEVFGDLHYIGRAGGRMGDALVDGAGSCEPLSHLVASAVFDGGHPDAIFLRYYGGDSGGGATHLAPVLLDGADEIDLLTGRPAEKAGIRFPASDLVEVYARAHGLAPPIAEARRGEGQAAGGASGERGGADGDAAEPPPPSSLSDGYPPNRDRFPGAVPLYATHAIQVGADPGNLPQAEPREEAADCAFFVRMAVLDPPKLGIDGVPVEIHRLPSSDQIDRTFAMIRAVEQAQASPKADAADRLMGAACLAAMYERASVDLTLVSQDALARVAADKRAKAAAEGEAALAKIDWSGREGAEVIARLGDRYTGRSWLLLVLAGGEDPVFRLVARGEKDDWGRINVLGALVVDAKTRARALDLLEARPKGEQVDVMHEVFHAHDHLRPWASNYALDVEGSAIETREFSRAYQVFRGLAWGLWEGARPPEEVLSRMVAEARRAGLPRAWDEVFLDYYVRNALNLHTHRADADEHARALKRWFVDQGYTDLEIYRARLAAP